MCLYIHIIILLKVFAFMDVVIHKDVITMSGAPVYGPRQQKKLRTTTMDKFIYIPNDNLWYVKIIGGNVRTLLIHTNQQKYPKFYKFRVPVITGESKCNSG